MRCEEIAKPEFLPGSRFCLDVDSKGPAARELLPALLLHSRNCLASRQKRAETDMNIDDYASPLQLHQNCHGFTGTKREVRI
jgi:hypothetical protein